MTLCGVWTQAPAFKIGTVQSSPPSIHPHLYNQSAHGRSVGLSVCLSVCLSVGRSVGRSVCLTRRTQKSRYFAGSSLHLFLGIGRRPLSCFLLDLETVKSVIRLPALTWQTSPPKRGGIIYSIPTSIRSFAVMRAFQTIVAWLLPTLRLSHALPSSSIPFDAHDCMSSWSSPDIGPCAKC